MELNEFEIEAVDYNNYKPFGILFDRTIPPENKDRKINIQ